jgi:hypothetical protein
MSPSQAFLAAIGHGRRPVLGLIVGIAAAILSGFGPTDVANADAPYDYVLSYRDWARSEPTSRQVDTAVTSLQAAAGAFGYQQRPGVASYAEGLLQSTSFGLANPHSSLGQYFSDRRYGTIGNPFDPARPDVLGVEIRVDDATHTVAVTLVARSWGNARNELRNLRVEDDVLVGTGASVGNLTATAHYAISLASGYIPG